jgi:hypothetical protein
VEAAVVEELSRLRVLGEGGGYGLEKTWGTRAAA